MAKKGEREQKGDEGKQMSTTRRERERERKQRYIFLNLEKQKQNYII